MNRPNILRGEELQPPPKQRRSRRRRDAILEAAMVRFSRDGFERTSIEGIAQAAGVATGAVYQFFGSKRQLLLVLMDTLLRRLDELDPPSFTQGKTILDGIEQFLTEAFARELEFVGVYRAWQEAALTDPAIDGHNHRIRSWTRARVRSLFAMLADLPDGRPDLDFDTLAKLWDGFFWTLLAQPPSDTKRAVRSIARILYHTLFLDVLADRTR